MSAEIIRGICRALTHVTENVQWGDDLVFKIGGKMFCVAYLEVPFSASFKVPPDRFEELQEIGGVIPAPYLARAGWLQIKRSDALRRSELEELIHFSYEFYWEKLSKAQRDRMQAGKSQPTKKRTKKI